MSRTVSNMRSGHVPLMEAIAAGQVVRDDCGGSRVGIWALYMLDGVEVGMRVRFLRKQRWVDAPLMGPPRLTEDGERWLRAQLANPE